MTDETVKVEIVGESKSAVDAMRAAAASVKTGVDDIKGHFDTLAKTAESINAAFLAIGAIFAGGKVFGEAIAETKKLAAESINLGRSLGISASEASGYATAIDEVGGTTGDFADASRGLTRQLKTNEKGLNELGLVTRDTHGNFRDMNDLLLDAITTVNSYAEGTDRNLAAQIAFGRGANANSPVLRLSKEQMDEAAVSASQLGLIIGQQSVDAFLANRKATAEASEVLKGFGKAIGDALLPVLTQLATWFREIGPAAIVVIKGAVGGLVAVFWGLVTAVRIVWDSLVGFINVVWEPLKRLSESLMALVHGDFAGAKAAWDGFGATMVKTWTNAHEAIVADATQARDEIWNLFAQQDPSKAPAEGKHVQKAAPDDTVVAKRRTLNAQLFQEAYRSMREIVGVEEARVSETEKLGELDVERQRDELRARVAMGLMTNAQEIDAERGLEQQRFALESQALQQRLTLATGDEVARAKILAQMTILEQKHANEVAKIDQKAALERMRYWRGFFDSIRSGFQQAISGLLQGTQTLAGAFKGLFDSVVSSIASMLADIAVKWLTNQIMTRTVSTATAEAQIASNAAIAGAAGVASMAAAPWPIDMTAPAFGLEMAAAAAAFAPAASAAGGFDIPAGVNPVTQLHAKEMVLPADLSDVVRGRAAGGGSQVAPLRTQSAGSNHVLVAKKDLARFMKEANARFAFA